MWVGILDGLVVCDNDGVLCCVLESFGLGCGLVWLYWVFDGVMWIVVGEWIYCM